MGIFKEADRASKADGYYSQEEILARLSIEHSDADMVKALGKQLESLESYGLVEYSGRGWRWKG
ncbi:MAG: hypothetical protein QXV32_09545 [Conexivisphaerales archaeon]